MNVLCARTSLSAYGDFLYGFVLMIIFHAGNAAAWLWFITGSLVGGLIFTAVSLAFHTMTFYVGDTTVIEQLATEFAINFSVYPDKIYAPAVRALMYSLIPTGLAIHIPLRLAAGFSPWLALAALGGAALYCAAAGFFFYRGLRRYESGNVIVTKL